MEEEDKEEIKNDIKEEIIEKIKKEIREDDDSPGGLFIPAGALGGIGFGFLFGNLVAGLFIGLGLGFMFFVLQEIFIKNKNQ